jgi:hypothetical protein
LRSRPYTAVLTRPPIGIDPDPPEPPVGEPDWHDDEAVAQAAVKVRERLLGMLRPASLREGRVRTAV